MAAESDQASMEMIRLLLPVPGTTSAGHGTRPNGDDSDYDKYQRNLKCQQNKHWTYENGFGDKFQFYHPAPSENTKDQIDVIELPLQDLLAGWEQTTSPDKTVNPKLIISVFYWNCPHLSGEVEKAVSLMTEDLLGMVEEEDSWLVFHGTKESVSMLDGVMPCSREAPVVVVKPPPTDLGVPLNKGGEIEKTELSQAMMEVEDLKMKKYVICEDIVDICGKRDCFNDLFSNDGVCEVSVVISGDTHQVKTVIEHSVSIGRPVILVKGLGGAVDCLVSELQRKKDQTNDSGTDDTNESNTDAHGDPSQISEKDKSELKKFLENLDRPELLRVYNIMSSEKSVCLEMLNTLENTTSYNIWRNILLRKCIAVADFKYAKDSGLLPKTPEDLEEETLAAAVRRMREDFFKYFLQKDLVRDQKLSIEDMKFGYQWFRYREQKANLEKDIKVLIPSFSLTEKDKASKESGEKSGSTANIFILALLIEEPEVLESLKMMLYNKEVDINSAAAALCACELLKALVRERGKDLPHSEIYLQKSWEFGQMAEETIKRIYEENPDQTKDILLQKSEAWGNMSLMQLAMETRNISFLSLKPCQKVLGEVWMHGEAAFQVQACWESNEFLGKLSAPRVIYFCDLIGLLLFLVNFALLNISVLQTESFHWLEWIVLATVITFLMQEIGKTLGQASLSYFKDYFNMEFLSAAIYSVAFSVRVVAYCDPGKTEYMDAARVLFCVAFILFTLRLLRCCYISVYLGFTVHVIGEMLGLFLFLVNFSLLNILVLETESFHWLEWVVLITVIAFLMKDICQILGEALLSYFNDYFSIINHFSIVIYSVAFSVRVVAYYNPGRTEYMDAARALFSVAFILFTLRLLRCCYVSVHLGPTVHVIGKMVKILVKFLVILVIFFVAYAVASQAVLYPESKLSWALVFHVLRKPYWSIYGELFLDELEADESDQCATDPNLYDEYDQLGCVSQTGRYIALVFLGIYVLTVNMLLFNFLIAKFSSANAELGSTRLWFYQRVTILRAYSNHILPFPFTPFSLLLWCVCQQSNPRSTEYNNDVWAMEYALKIKPEPEQESVDDRLARMEELLRNTELNSKGTSELLNEKAVQKELLRKKKAEIQELSTMIKKAEAHISGHKKLAIKFQQRKDKLDGLTAERELLYKRLRKIEELLRYRDASSKSGENQETLGHLDMRMAEIKDKLMTKSELDKRITDMEDKMMKIYKELLRHK